MKTKTTLLLNCVFLLLSSVPTLAQDLGFQRSRYVNVLSVIKDDVKKYYYDASFHGVEIDAKYRAASDDIKKANSIGQMNSIIAQFLIEFNDSHLFYSPPGKANKTDYGFEMRSFGEKCFVTRVKSKSDAGVLGLAVGDEIVSIEGYAPTREGLWLINYAFRVLTPRPTLKLSVKKPDGKVLNYEIKATITPGRQLKGQFENDWQDLEVKSEDEYVRATRQGFYDKIDGLFIWKMPGFALEPGAVDGIFDRIRKKHGSLIIDLRGNGGGRVDMLLRMLGNLFPESVKVGDEKGRKETKEIIAKSRGKDTFDGKLIVLVDSGSASASEIFSKVVQLQKRGLVFGDQSAGAVMESRHYSHSEGADIVVFFGASITIADIIMTDNKSLEKIGVTPDEKILPTAVDLARRLDPVMSRAAAKLGFALSPEDAGKMFGGIDDPEK